MDRGEATWGVEHDDVPRIIRRFAERHGPDVQAGVPDEFPLRAEREPPDRRVHPVRADHQVEPARGGVLEDDVDPALVLRQRGDGVTEEEFRVVTRRLVKHVGEIGSRDLDLFAHRHPHGGHRTPLRVEQPQPLRVRRDLAQPRQDTHRAGHLHRTRPDVHRVAAAALTSRALDDSRPETVSRQPKARVAPAIPAPHTSTSRVMPRR